MISESRTTIISLIFLAVCAYFINLDSHHMFVHTDEPRRTVVALEMLLQQNYFYPTINGEPYLNKTGFFNWFIIAFYKLFGSYSEGVSRLVTLLFAFGSGYLCYKIVLEISSKKVAILSAVGFLTSFRFLFYDSFLTMIDLPFAFFLLGGYYLTQKHLRHKRIIHLFSGCLMFACAFLVRGLPALYFQFVSCAFLFWPYRKQKAYILKSSVIICTATASFILPYYILYFLQSEVSGSEYLSNLFNETSKRTVGVYSVADTWNHLVTFPFYAIFSFFPWSFGLLGVFIPSVGRKVMERRNLSLLLFIVIQCMPYFISVEARTRYLYPILPFAFALSIQLASNIMELGSAQNALKLLLKGVIAFAGVGLAYAFTTSPKGMVEGLPVLVHVLSYVLLAAIFISLKNLKLSSSYLVVFLTLRILFNIYALPERNENMSHMKESALEVAMYTKDSPLCLYERSWVQDGTTYYLTKVRKKVLVRCNKETIENLAEGSKKVPRNELKQRFFVLADMGYVEKLKNQGYREAKRFYTRYKEQPVFLLEKSFL